MDSQQYSTPASRAQDRPQASTRHVVVTGRFAALLAEDFGLDWAVVVEALITEPCKQAIAICEWAERKEEPAKALLAWSRKHHKGTHRPPPALRHRRTGPGQGHR